MILHLDLFTGYGGFSLGLQLAGLHVRTVAYVEWAKYPQEIIKARIKDGWLPDAPIFSDISSFRGEQFRGLGDVLVTAGFPCQPHSVAGLKRGANDERNLWPETLRVIREVGARWVILENVPGLLSASSDGGTPAYGGTVVGELASLGYSVHWQTIGADNVGAPHRRKRWWCIAVADSRQQPTRAEGNRLDGRWEDAGAEARVGATERNGFADSDNSLADSDGTRSTAHPRDSGEERSLSETQRQPEHDPVIPWGSGPELADSDGNGTEWGQPQHWARGRAEYGIEELADSDKRSRIQRKLAEGSAYPIRGIGQLADSEYDGFITPAVGASEPGTVHDRGAEGTDSTRQLEGVCPPRNAPPELADSDGQRGTRWNQPQWTYAGDVGQPSETEESGWGIPIWPPGPSDTSGWEQVIRVRPDLAPALTKDTLAQFRGVDDGRSHRVDELKALGNGLLPAVAAEFLRRITRKTP